MESLRSSKRRRIIQSYVSPRRRPDLPACFECLNDDTLTTVVEFVGNKSYKSFGGVNKHCKEIYLVSGMTKETFLYGYGPLSVIQDKIEEGGRFHRQLYEAVGKGVVFYNRSDVLAWVLQERNIYGLSVICEVASEEGRIDLLDEMWNNVNDEDDKEDVFRYVNRSANRGGKLNVLKWLEAKGLSFNKESCAESAAHHGQLHIIQWLTEEKGSDLYIKKCAREAARYGQLHIIQWLIEERGLELHGDLYNSAICGGQLHVMKWLREQEVDWSKYTFKYAAIKGNLDFLQWLHDEGCPWPEDDWYCMYEDEIELEVIHWCRANGYSNRLVWSEPRVIY